MDAVVSKVALSAVVSVAWPCVLGRGGLCSSLGLDGGPLRGTPLLDGFPYRWQAVPVLAVAEGALPPIVLSADLARLVSGHARRAGLGEGHDCCLDRLEALCHIGIILIR